MKEIVADKALVAYCGLYCGACRKYRVGKCPGCHENEKASWCKVRSCCVENGHTSCADCHQYDDIMECKGFNNFISRIFSLVFNSNRESCIKRIGEAGLETFASEMAQKGMMSHKRKP